MRQKNPGLIWLACVLGMLLSLVAPASGEVDHDGETPVVVVDNDGARYTHVRTSELEYTVATRIKLPQGASPSGGTVTLGGRKGSPSIDINAGGGWSLTKVRFPYSPPRGFEGDLPRDPVAICNQNLDAKKGTAVEQMRESGLRVMLPRAYPVRVVAQYWEKENVVGVREEGTRTLEGDFPAWLECAPLAGPKVRTKTTTTGSSAPRAKRARDVNPMRDFSFTATAAKRKQVDGRYCPLSLRLTGTVEAANPFTGHATFFGSGYVSDAIPLDVARSGSQQVAASIPLDWSKASKGYRHTGPRGRNAREYVLQMQVADSTGRVLGTSPKTPVKVSCEPTRASAAGGAAGAAGAEPEAEPEPEGIPDPLVRSIRPREGSGLEVFVYSRGATSSGCTLGSEITIDGALEAASYNVSPVGAGVTLPVLVTVGADVSQIDEAIFTLDCPADSNPSNNVGSWQPGQGG